MGFSRQEYWSGLPFPPPGSLPDPGIQLTIPVSPSLAGGFFTTEPGKHLSLEDKTNFLKPPESASGKASACQCRDLRDAERGRSPGGGNGSPLQYSCLRNPILCPWGPKELSRLSTHTPQTPGHKKAPVTGMCQTCAWPPELPCPGATLKLLPSCSVYTVARISLPVSS